MVSNIFYFHPYLGKIPILTTIFQGGWNHQLDNYKIRNGWNRLLPWNYVFGVSYGLVFFLNAFDRVGFKRTFAPQTRSGRKSTIGVVIDTINIPKRIYQKETNKGQKDSRIRSYRKMKLIPIQSTSFFSPACFEWRFFNKQNLFNRKAKGKTKQVHHFFTEKKMGHFIPIQTQSESQNSVAFVVP